MRQLLLAGLVVAVPASATPPSQCSSDSACDRVCADRAAELAAPQRIIAGFESATCQLYRSTGIETMACWCQETTGASYEVLHAADGGCAASGREGQCIYRSDEVRSCVDAGSPDDSICRPQCDTLAGRMNADAMRQLSISVKGAACWGRTGAGMCDCAFQSADTCFVNFNVAEKRFDCSREGKEAIRELGHDSCGCSSMPGALALLALAAVVRRSYRR